MRRREPRIAVFDAAIPPGLAFIRSLGRAGLQVIAYSDNRYAAGRLSRYVAEFRSCPNVLAVDEFVPWLLDAVEQNEFDLIAPTSDYVVFATAEATERTRGAFPSLPAPDAARTCLFKVRFAEAMGEAGLPAPPSVTPVTFEAAKSAAASLGYPVLLKPRSHVGIGHPRGGIVRSPEELRRHFVPFPNANRHRLATEHDADLGVPMLQKYFDRTATDVVSVSGCLGPSGERLAVGHSRQLRQWPPTTGVGTLFEALPEQPFTQKALAAVRHVVGAGLFELEVLVDRQTGECWALDLNPRGFGQMALDMAQGNDLPLLWFGLMTGRAVDVAPTRQRPVRYWTAGVPLAVETAVRLSRGPNRGPAARKALTFLRQPRIGASFVPADPLPGIANGLLTLRHPRALVREYLQRG